MNQLVSRISSTLGTTLLLQAAGFLSGILLARGLAPEGRGELALILLWTSLIAYLGDLGGPVSYSYQSASATNDMLRHLFWNSIFFVCVQSVLLSIAGYFIIPIALHGTVNATTKAIGFLFAWLPLTLFTRYSISTAQGRQDFRIFNLCRISVQLVYVIIVIAAYSSSYLSTTSALIALLVSNGVTSILSLRAYHGVSLRPAQMNVSIAKQSISYGIRAHIGTASPLDILRPDLLMVAAFLGTREAGLYTVAVSFATIIRAQGVAVGMVTLPEVANSSTTEQAQIAISRSFQLCLVIVGGAAGIGAALTPLLLPKLFGSAYQTSTLPTMILLVAMAFSALRQVLADSMRGAGQPMVGTIAEISSWLISIGGLAVLVPRWGLTGAAVSQLVAYTVSAIVSIQLVKRHRGLTYSQLCIPSRADLYWVRVQANRAISQLGGHS